jgi:hypothetical protein
VRKKLKVYDIEGCNVAKKKMIGLWEVEVVIWAGQDGEASGVLAVGSSDV